MGLEKIVANLVQKVERRFYGKYRGFVVENVDPEQLGRLKIRIPSVLGNDVDTGWAMPCVPYGGDSNLGFLFIPEVETGVWVEFEEGDLEFPIWIGTFWSKPGGESELPKPNDADGKEQDSVQDPPTRKILKTKKGHTIQLEDADNEEMVTIIEATKGHVILMNKDGIKITDGANKHEVILNKDGIGIKDGANKHEVVLDKNGIGIKDGVNKHEVVLDKNGITFTDGKNSGNQVVMNSGGVTIESAADVTIKGKNINIEAQAKLAAKGNPIHLNP